MKLRIVAWLLLITAVGAYLTPLIRGDHIVWVVPVGKEESYVRESILPFTGYIFPTFLLVILSAALSPWLLATERFPLAIQQQVRVLGKFSGLLLGVLAVLYMIWVVSTPLFG